MYFCIIGLNVFFFLLSIGTMKTFDLSFFSLLPKTHLPSNCHPLLYFFFPNFDSSISTFTLGPPIGSVMHRTVKKKNCIPHMYSLYVFPTCICIMYSSHVFLTCIHNVYSVNFTYVYIPVMYCLHIYIKDMFNFQIAC